MTGFPNKMEIPIKAPIGCPLPSPLFKIFFNNLLAKPLRLVERAGLIPRSYRVVGQAELGMSHWHRAAEIWLTALIINSVVESNYVIYIRTDTI